MHFVKSFKKDQSVKSKEQIENSFLKVYLTTEKLEWGIKEKNDKELSSV